MKFLKVQKKDAEKIRKELISNEILSSEYSVIQDEGVVLFPVIKNYLDFEIIERNVKKKQHKPKNLKDELSKLLTEKESELLVTSFDIIGDIAIVEIPEELILKQQKIGETILQIHKNVKTVLKKLGPMEGEYRVRKLEVIAGEDRTETVYKENGALMKLDLAKVYFSVRLAFERLRIANLVKPNEKVLVLFAGVGPFAFVISKKHPGAKITAVELNPDAVAYMNENIKLNHMTNINAIECDARNFNEKNFDRIIMPLPKSGHEFLDVAFSSIKSGGTIHFYSWADAKNPFAEPMKKAKEIAQKSNVFIEFENIRIVRPYAPNIVQVVLDILVSTNQKSK